MGLKEMQIMFDNPWATYYAGYPVSGQLILKLDAPKKVRSVSIKFKGEANVSWSEQESQTNSEGKSESVTVWYTSHEQYFQNKFFLLGGQGATTEIPPGTHTYNFSTILPPSLPSSFEGEYGHVRYTVKATLDRPWKFDQDCKVAFTVVSPLDLNQTPDAKLPIRIHDEKFVGMCCCESGPLSVSLDVPFSGFVSGQYIPVAIEIENLTTRSVTSSECILRKNVVFTAHHPRHKTRESRVVIANVRLGSLGAHSSNRYTENLLVPPLPPSNLYNCSIIDINYCLKVETSVSGFCARGLDVKVPITFGTTPLAESLTSAQPFAPPVQIAEEKPAIPTTPAVGWNPPSAPSAPCIPAAGAPQPPPYPNMGDNPNGLYPNMAPPSYEECMYSKTCNNIRDEDDSEHTQGMDINWVPRYPTYKFNPSAPELTA